MIPQRPTRVGYDVPNLILVLKTIEKSDGDYEKERGEYKKAASDGYQHYERREKEYLCRVSVRVVQRQPAAHEL